MSTHPLSVAAYPLGQLPQEDEPPELSMQTCFGSPGFQVDGPPSSQQPPLLDPQLETRRQDTFGSPRKPAGHGVQEYEPGVLVQVE